MNKSELINAIAEKRVLTAVTIPVPNLFISLAEKKQDRVVNIEIIIVIKL